MIKSNTQAHLWTCKGMQSVWCQVWFCLITPNTVSCGHLHTSVGGQGEGFPPPLSPLLRTDGLFALCLLSALVLPALTWTGSLEMTEGRRSCQGNNPMVLICRGQCSPLTALVNSPGGKLLPCLDKFLCSMTLSFWACWQQVACLCDGSSPAITLAFCPIPPQRCSCWGSPGLCFWACEGQYAQGKPSSLGYSAFLGLMDRICWPWRRITEFD